MYTYEIGYGTYEESAYELLTHEQFITTEELENMFIDCIVKAAIDQRTSEEADFASPEFKQTTAESAVFNRKNGDEFMYEICINELRNPHELTLTYQNLHDKVIQLMCSDFGFSTIKREASAYVFGWADLSVENDWGDSVTDLTKRASAAVRSRGIKPPTKNTMLQDRDSRLESEPEKVYAEDRALIESLGVEYIEYDDPTAVRNRTQEEW